MDSSKNSSSSQQITPNMRTSSNKTNSIALQKVINSTGMSMMPRMEEQVMAALEKNPNAKEVVVHMRVVKVPKGASKGGKKAVKAKVSTLAYKFQINQKLKQKLVMQKRQKYFDSLRATKSADSNTTQKVRFAPAQHIPVRQATPTMSAFNSAVEPTLKQEASPIPDAIPPSPSRISAERLAARNRAIIEARKRNHQEKFKQKIDKRNKALASANPLNLLHASFKACEFPNEQNTILGQSLLQADTRGQAELDQPNIRPTPVTSQVMEIEEVRDQSHTHDSLMKQKDPDYTSENFDSTPRF